MIFNEAITGLLAIVLAYLVGSFPTAHVITRLATGKDIRQLGSGNMGANNTWREVSPVAGITVGFLDVGKGAIVVFSVHQLLGVPLFEADGIALLAGIAAVAGHIWPVYLKFTGGNGLLTTVGVFILELPREMLVVLAIVVLLIAITRNVVLSMNLSLLSVPISAWFLEGEWLYVGFFGVLALMMMYNFQPTAREAAASVGTRKNLINELLRHRRH
jgi:glycerol-3-phosphate acyltransferase PlsY